VSGSGAGDGLSLPVPRSVDNGPLPL
jgi:hypothetical protein